MVHTPSGTELIRTTSVQTQLCLIYLIDKFSHWCRRESPNSFLIEWQNVCPYLPFFLLIHQMPTRPRCIYYLLLKLFVVQIISYYSKLEKQYLLLFTFSGCAGGGRAGSEGGARNIRNSRRLRVQPNKKRKGLQGQGEVLHTTR